MTAPPGSLQLKKDKKVWEVKLMVPWLNQFKVFSATAPSYKGGTCSNMTCWKFDLHLCSFFSWLPAPLPEPWLLQPATYLCVSLRLPGAPLWGGGPRASVHPRQRRPEACSTRDQPFPERPTAETAIREASHRYHQGPDPTTCDHQTACCVSDAAVPPYPILIIAREPHGFAK